MAERLSAEEWGALMPRRMSLVKGVIVVGDHTLHLAAHLFPLPGAPTPTLGSQSAKLDTFPPISI